MVMNNSNFVNLVGPNIEIYKGTLFEIANLYGSISKVYVLYGVILLMTYDMMV